MLKREDYKNTDLVQMYNILMGPSHTLTVSDDSAVSTHAVHVLCTVDKFLYIPK